MYIYMLYKPNPIRKLQYPISYGLHNRKKTVYKDITYIIFTGRQRVSRQKVAIVFECPSPSD